MKTTEVVCDRCGCHFKRVTKEVTRSLKLGRKQYCSRSCSIAVSNGTCPSRGNKVPPDKTDMFTRFRFFLRKSRMSIQRHGADITAADLALLWQAQQGKCCYTGLPMVLPDTVSGWYVNPGPFGASLDRIDSSKGYELNNVEFVCRFVNLGKNTSTKQQVKDFIAALRTVK